MIGGSLVRWFLKKGTSCRMILPVRNLARAREQYKGILDSDGQKLIFMEMRLEDLWNQQIPMPIDYIIHCACVTQSSEMVAHPVETADSIVMGTRNVLELARKKQVKSMVYVSSMEVYGIVEDTGKRTGEEHLGVLDLKACRSCYPMGKRMAEHYCAIYHQEYKVPVKIARLSQIFGQGVRPEDNRVYMQFARAAYEGKDIVLKTEGKSVGNYCATDDAVEGILTILYRGEDGEPYNVVNEANTMRIREMADLVANRVAGGRIKVRIGAEDSHKTGYAPDTGLRLSGEKLKKLGWVPEKNLEDMYQDVIGELRSGERIICDFQ